MIPEFSFDAQLYTIEGEQVAPVEACEIVADSTWSPRFQATVTATLTPALLAAEVVRLQLRRMGGRALSLLDWSARWGGRVEDLTAESPGSVSPGTFTAALGGSEDPAPSQEITLTMIVRDILPDDVAGTAKVTLSSYEAELQEIRNFQLNGPLPGSPGTDLPELPRFEWWYNGGFPLKRTVVEDVITRIVPGARFVTDHLPTTPGSDPARACVPAEYYERKAYYYDPALNETIETTYPATPDDTRWAYGQTAYEFLEWALDSLAALWTEDGRNWHVTTAQALYESHAVDPATLHIEKASPVYRPRRGRTFGRLTTYTDPTSKNIVGDDFTAYVLEGPRGVYAGEAVDYQITLDKAELGTPGTVDVRTAPPAPPVLAGMTLEGIADLTLRPEYRLDWTHTYATATLPDAVIDAGQIKTIRWQYPEGTMSVDIEPRPTVVTPPSIPAL